MEFFFGLSRLPLFRWAQRTSKSWDLETIGSVRRELWEKSEKKKARERKYKV